MNEPNIIADISLVEAPEGKISGIGPKMFRCPLIIDGTWIDCQLDLDENKKVFAGESFSAGVRFMNPKLAREVVREGSIFDLWDLKIFAHGVVRKVVKL